MAHEHGTFRPDRRFDFIVSLIVASLAMLIGVSTVINVFIGGPHDALSSYVPWGLCVSVYVYLVWLEVGMILAYFAMSRIFKVAGLVPLGPVVTLAAFAVLLAALGLIGLDLGHPLRAWRPILQPNLQSPMAWMIWLHVIYLAVLAVELLAYRTKRQGWVKALNWISVPIGVALIAIIGGLFGVVAARPFWNASVLPMAFFLSSLVAGIGLLALLHVLFSPTAGTPAYSQTAADLARVFKWAIVVGLIGAAANILVIAYPNVPAHAKGLHLALFGPYWWTIWIVHVLVGVAIPLVLLIIRPKSHVVIAIAAGLFVVTFVAVPLNIVIPGQAYVPADLTGLAEAYHDRRLSFDYFPALSEWRGIVFIAGLALAIFTICYPVFIGRIKRTSGPSGPTATLAAG